MEGRKSVSPLNVDVMMIILATNHISLEFSQVTVMSRAGRGLGHPQLKIRVTSGRATEPSYVTAFIFVRAMGRILVAFDCHDHISTAFTGYLLIEEKRYDVL